MIKGMQIMMKLNGLKVTILQEMDPRLQGILLMLSPKMYIEKKNDFTRRKGDLHPKIMETLMYLCDNKTCYKTLSFSTYLC